MAANAAIYVASAVMAGSAYSADQNAKTQRKDAKKEVKRQEAQLAAEQADIAEQEQKDIAMKANSEAIKRQRALRGKKQGRDSTILTSPLGTTGATDTGTKTLLGS